MLRVEGEEQLPVQDVVSGVFGVQTIEDDAWVGGWAGMLGWNAVTLNSDTLAL